MRGYGQSKGSGSPQSRQWAPAPPLGCQVPCGCDLCDCLKHSLKKDTRGRRSYMNEALTQRGWICPSWALKSVLSLECVLRAAAPNALREARADRWCPSPWPRRWSWHSRCPRPDGTQLLRSYPGPVKSSCDGTMDPSVRAEPGSLLLEALLSLRQA